MAVLTAPAAPLTPALPQATGPSCNLQRSGSLWQLGIEAQELTTAIGQLAGQLEADDPEKRTSALAELEAALLAEESNKAALSAKADVTCWVIEHLRCQAAYRQQQPKRLTELSRSDAMGVGAAFAFSRQLSRRISAITSSQILALTRFRSRRLARKPARAPRMGSGPGTSGVDGPEEEEPSRLIWNVT